jgi:hypothetical protein
MERPAERFHIQQQSLWFGDVAKAVGDQEEGLQFGQAPAGS